MRCSIRFEDWRERNRRSPSPIAAREPCGDSRNSALFWHGRKFTSEHSVKSFLVLGMKRGPLGLHVVNEIPKSLVRLLVGYAGDKASVVFNLFVEFSALITHSHFQIRANLP
jgi:hypothetical protein